MVRKEALAALAGLFCLCALSAVFDAPLEGPADPNGIPEGTVKAPWIFVGVQQTLRYLSPFLAGVLLPLATLVGIALIPYLPHGTPAWRRGVSIWFFTTLAVSAALTLWGYLA